MCFFKNFESGRVQIIVILIICRVFVAMFPELELYLQPLREIAITTLVGIMAHSLEKFRVQN